ncbi:MAG: glutaminyl-peptide cyclotransferase [Acidobacteriota bacterium]
MPQDPHETDTGVSTATSRMLWKPSGGVYVALVAATVALAIMTWSSDTPGQTPAAGPDRAPSEARSPAGKTTGPIERMTLEVIAVHAHDPQAFTQGLLWHEGWLYESTGLYGQSTVRRVKPETGVVVASRATAPDLFGEGLVLVGENLYQLTWKAGILQVWDRETLELVDQLGYRGEGWGLAYDGDQFIMSDGSAILRFRDVNNFQVVREITVTRDGRTVRGLNELEWVDGRIWANILGRDELIRIDPSSGGVDAYVDASGLLAPQIRRGVDVLNGIAWDADTGTFWITGKFWPSMFQVRLVSAAATR